MVFGFASLNAWMLGRADVARERMARMTSAADENHPYEMAWSAYLAADCRDLLGEYEQAEALAAACARTVGEKSLSASRSMVPTCSRSGASAAAVARPRASR